MENKKLLILIVFLLLVTGIFYVARYNFSNSNNPEPVYCTQDAKLCPNGTYVGRVGPKCEFSACPDVSSGVSGIVLLGPTCPVIKDPPEPECADKPYATKLVITTSDQAFVIIEFSSDESGKFNVQLAPGEYAIRSAVAANVLPYCSSEAFKVEENKFTDITVSCDTGIR